MNHKNNQMGLHPEANRQLAEQRLLEPLLQITLLAVQSIWPANNLHSPYKKLTPNSSHSSSLLSNDDPLDFIQQVIRRSRTNSNALKICLFYLHQARKPIRQRIAQADPNNPNYDSDPTLSGHKMFVSALILASKFLQDRNFSNRTWAKIAGFSINELNTSERVFLSLIEYRSHVDLSAFEIWCARLQKLMDEKRISRPKPDTADYQSNRSELSAAPPLSHPSYSSQRRHVDHRTSARSSLSSATLVPQLPLSHDSSSITRHPLIPSPQPSINGFVTPLRQQSHPSVSSRITLATAPPRLSLSGESISRTVDNGSRFSDLVTPTHQKTFHPTILRAQLATAPAHVRYTQVGPSTSSQVSDAIPARAIPTPISTQPRPLRTSSFSSSFRPDSSARQGLYETPTKTVAPQSISPISIRAFKKPGSPHGSLSRTQTSNVASGRLDEGESGPDTRSTIGSCVETPSSLAHQNITSPDVAQAEKDLLEKVAKVNSQLAEEEAQANLRLEEAKGRLMTAEDIQRKHLDLLATERRLKEEEIRLKEQERRLLEQHFRLQLQKLKFKREQEERGEKVIRERLRRLVDVDIKSKSVLDPIPDPFQKSKTPILSHAQERSLNESIGVNQPLVYGRRLSSSDDASNSRWNNELQQLSYDDKAQDSNENEDEDDIDWKHDDIPTPDDHDHRSRSIIQTKDDGDDDEGGGTKDLVWRKTRDDDSFNSLNLESRQLASKIDAEDLIGRTSYALLKQQSRYNAPERTYAADERKSDLNHQDITSDELRPVPLDSSRPLSLESRQVVPKSGDDNRLVSKDHRPQQQRSRHTTPARTYLDDHNPREDKTKTGEEKVNVVTPQRVKNNDVERIKLSSDRDPPKLKPSPTPSPSNNVRPSLMAKLQREDSMYGYPKEPERYPGERSSVLLPTPSVNKTRTSAAMSSIGDDQPNPSGLTSVTSHQHNPQDHLHHAPPAPQRSSNYPHRHHRGITPPLQISQRPLNSCAFQENHPDYINHYHRFRAGLVESSLRINPSHVSSVNLGPHATSSSISRGFEDSNSRSSHGVPSTPSYYHHYPSSTPRTTKISTDRVIQKVPPTPSTKNNHPLDYSVKKDDVGYSSYYQSSSNNNNNNMYDHRYPSSSSSTTVVPKNTDINNNRNHQYSSSSSSTRPSTNCHYTLPTPTHIVDPFSTSSNSHTSIAIPRNTPASSFSSHLLLNNPLVRHDYAKHVY